MKERPYWEKVLVQIWPTIRRVLSDTWFFLERIIRSFIHTVLQEI